MAEDGYLGDPGLSLGPDCLPAVSRDALQINMGRQGQGDEGDTSFAWAVSPASGNEEPFNGLLLSSLGCLLVLGGRGSGWWLANLVKLSFACLLLPGAQPAQET